MITCTLKEKKKIIDCSLFDTQVAHMEAFVSTVSLLEMVGEICDSVRRLVNKQQDYEEALTNILLAKQHIWSTLEHIHSIVPGQQQAPMIDLTDAVKEEDMYVVKEE
jgi:hypothetical protein